MVSKTLEAIIERGEVPELGPDNSLPAETSPDSMAAHAKAEAAQHRLESGEKLPPEEELALSALVENGKAQEVVDMANNTVKEAQRGREAEIKEELFGEETEEIKAIQKEIAGLEKELNPEDMIVGGLGTPETIESVVGGIGEAEETQTTEKPEFVATDHSDATEVTWQKRE